MSDLAEALTKLSACSLQHEYVAQIRKGNVDADGDGVPDDVEEEPTVHTRAESKEWRKWAHSRAKEHADTIHPRLQRKGTTPARLPLRAKPNDVIEQVGIVPALYLDFLKFGAAYCGLGMLLAAIPSYVLSASHAREAYDAATLNGFPAMFLYLAVGARMRCTSPTCQLINLITAVCEAVFSLLLLAGTLHFIRRAERLRAINDANNVYTREYAVQLHGMPADATADEIRTHLERCLREFLREKAHRRALKQAPLERKCAVLDRKATTLQAFREERDTGRGLARRIAKVGRRMERVATKLVGVRETMSTRGLQAASTVCGAFVTFEEQPTAHACLRLFGGSPLAFALQRKDLRLRGRRLRAYPACQPRDILHENLPYRILALDGRGLATLCRRLLAFLILVVFMAASFAAIIAVNAVKQDPAIVTRGAAAATAKAEDGDTTGSNTAVLVNQIGPAAASMVVVIVNQAIVFVVGALGHFQRHPTLSAMHRSKVVTILIGAAFNTGLLPAIVSMAPPPRSFTGEYAQCSCECRTLSCCLVGPRGVIARGKYLSMSAGWHQDVGTIITSSLFIQAVVSLVGWIAPCAVTIVKRRLKQGGVLHRLDMEALYEGPLIDLPKFIGKAYAFFAVLLIYAAILPALYPIGVIFFAGTWLAERYALLRVHRTPPPYSSELISTTLGWMPWAVCAHLGVAFWGFASLPSQPLGAGEAWAAPRAEALSCDALKAANWTTWASVAGAGAGAASTLLSGGSSALAGTDQQLSANATASSLAALDALHFLYDLPRHVNSVPCLLLFACAALLLLGLLLARLRASALYLPLVPLEAAMAALLTALMRRGSSRRVHPHDGHLDAPAHAVIDPPFSKVLCGVERDGVRTLHGKILHEAQLQMQLTRCARLASWTPSAVLFRALGMSEAVVPVSPDEWQRAVPVFTRLARAADVSYQPTFHPMYEKAFAYLSEAPSPTFLAAAFIAKTRRGNARGGAAGEQEGGSSSGEAGLPHRGGGAGSAGTTGGHAMEAADDMLVVEDLEHKPVERPTLERSGTEAVDL